jgi:hypothetical protein
MSIRGPKTKRKVDDLSLIFVDFYAALLTPSLNRTDKGMVRSDISKPALNFFFTTRVHTTKYTVKILAANTHCKYFLKITEHGQYCSLPDPWRNVHP